jgi:hypothetical protein
MWPRPYHEFALSASIHWVQVKSLDRLAARPRGRRRAILRNGSLRSERGPCCAHGIGCSAARRLPAIALTCLEWRRGCTAAMRATRWRLRGMRSMTRTWPSLSFESGAPAGGSPAGARDRIDLHEASLASCRSRARRRRGTVLGLLSLLALSSPAWADPCSQAYSTCVHACRRMPLSDRPGVSRCVGHCDTQRAACREGRTTLPPRRTPSSAASPTQQAPPSPSATEQTPARQAAAAATGTHHLAPAATPIPAAAADATEDDGGAPRGDCEACARKCRDRCARRLYRCSFQCAERFRRTTAAEERRCQQACECEVYGCDGEGGVGTYCGDCAVACPCEPPLTGRRADH